MRFQQRSLAETRKVEDSLFVCQVAAEVRLQQPLSEWESVIDQEVFHCCVITQKSCGRPRVLSSSVSLALSG